jgi:FMN phosphatase YigB (HAD superfamily)
MTLKAVFFDVGETLIDETRDWGEWADYLGVTRLTFFAALGAVISRGQHHREVFNLFRPACDFAALKAQREAQGRPYAVKHADLYPDAVPCLGELRARGIRVGIAGNQPVAIEGALAALGVPVDILASSASWGVEKPSPAFFDKVIEAAGGLAPAEIAYVGDRLDNDVLPATKAGMAGIFLRRGPWAAIQSSAQPQLAFEPAIDSLSELPALLHAISTTAAGSRSCL